MSASIKTQVFFFCVFFIQGLAEKVHTFSWWLFTNWIQALQYWLKKCVDHKGENVGKYLGQPMNFSANPYRPNVASSVSSLHFRCKTSGVYLSASLSHGSDSNTFYL